ncbi:MAG: hypothetical protein KKB20_19430 [Proteobacteria bacterium]|nr:hypothetical protein [Pseudomonadota bacterium]
MELTVLGSGGCMVIPKPLCRCRVCEEARTKGEPYRRTGPSAYIREAGLLIDAPAEIAYQLNRSKVPAVERMILTHLDPDHIEGLRVVEQITLDFRTWEAYPDKRIQLFVPRGQADRLGRLQSQYGSLIEYYQRQGFIDCRVFDERTRIGPLDVTALPVRRPDQTAYVLVFEMDGRRLVYAPCDLKPFPEERPEVHRADLLVIQPGLFENGLRHGFVYPEDHVSRTTLYTMGQTLKLARRIEAREVLFVHLEEYWNRSYDDYLTLETDLDGARFAYDGLCVRV